MTITPEDILDFWFPGPLDTPDAIDQQVKMWFGGSKELDAQTRNRFAGLPSGARKGEFEAWRGSAHGCLALVLVLDQFPRNLYRGTPDSFAFDARAREIALAAIEREFDQSLTPIEAAFMYMPLEHAEDLELQERSVALFKALAARAPESLKAQFNNFVDYAVRHHGVIERFGRFPHRNEVLGRESTQAEREYLDAGGDAF